MPGPSQARGRARALAIDRDALRAAYEEGASTVDLALQHGISRTTIRCLLQAMGCPLRNVRAAAKARSRPSWLRLPPPEPVQDAFNVVDVDGRPYDVSHRTPTRHGFAILRGHGGSGGPMAIILTPELSRHLERHRLDPRNLALPLSQAVINRLRRRLGHDYAAENRRWWAERRGDLDALSCEAFAARHGVPAGTAMVMRQRLCGLREKRGSWLDEAALEILRSALPARAAAARLGQPLAVIYNHRRRLRQEDAGSAAMAIPPTMVGGDPSCGFVPNGGNVLPLSSG